MKKIIILFTLSFVLSLSAFAGDGITPIGGSKTCPQGQTTCFTGDGITPIGGGKTSPQGQTTGLVSQQPTETEETVYTKIYKFLNEIFG
ncbi:MAG: hypothetical protein LUM44_02060 [Pyrinomonadaceae bacterium]|nr:hypothetical protein [Pyrinomonadaceae bacterium]